MYIVVIGWLYVAMMMAVAEANNSTGTLLGALVTFVLYGALPVALVIYLMLTPARKRVIKAREAAAWEAQKAATRAEQGSEQPDASGEAAAAAVPAVRKEL